ncbi:peptidase inhibitor family I36 protein [Amycolatopsis sp. NPDC059657]|uniref:peptidase inhibitor family I36 protein n=1 Tax=Amycolatopsis sp. NPDC059657 TaxID=3346899 RepID=UPI00366C6440
MRKLTARLSAGLLVAAAAAVLSPAQQASAGEPARACPAGFSCYYNTDHFYILGRMYIAPSPGCRTVADMGLDDVRSIYNRGGGEVRVYNRNGQYMTAVPPGGSRDMLGQRVTWTLCAD